MSVNSASGVLGAATATAGGVAVLPLIKNNTLPQMLIITTMCLGALVVLSIIAFRIYRKIKK